MVQQAFVEKALPAMAVAQIVDTIAELAEIGERLGPMFRRLATAMLNHGVPPGEPSLTWYRPTDDGLRIAVAFPVPPAAAAGLIDAGIDVTKLSPVAHAVTTLHHGGMDTIGSTWQALVRYANGRGYQSVGTCRELYLYMPLDGDPDTWITELQQPVSRPDHRPLPELHLPEGTRQRPDPARGPGGAPTGQLGRRAAGSGLTGKMGV